MTMPVLRGAAALAILAGFVAAPLVGLGDYWLYTVTIGFYYAILAASWSLLVGYVGRISFAQAAMSGLGAYGSILAIQHFALPLPLAVLVGIAVAATAGLVVGWLSLRMHGAYLGLTTIAFSEILRIAITAEHQFTQGSRGLQAPALLAGGSRLAYYYLFLAITVGCLAVMGLLLRSRLGLFFQAIREDEDGAASLGVNVTLWKVVAFAISCGFAGLGGALYAHFVQLVAPSMMSLQEMGYVLTMAVIGGFHNVLFAALGGVFLQLVLESLRAIGEWRLVIFGLIAILMLRFAPNGLFGMAADALFRSRRGS